ncbi:hypothetical protein ACFL52_03365 [Candidatus Margulisiibacteriota bacterium]
MQPALAEIAWDFSSDTEGWQVQQDIAELNVKAGTLSGRITGKMPVLISPDLFLEADEDTLLEIRLKSSSNQAILFWVGTFDSILQSAKQIPIPLKSNQEYNTYYIDIRSRNKLWSGSISKVIFVPGTATGSFSIDYIKFYRPGMINKIKAGWSEFWGPNGRQISGSTINNIKSSTFMGKTINTYFYWLILLISIYWAVKNRKIGRSKIITTLFIFWILLEINSLFNQFSQAQQDYPMIGKSIKERQAIVTGEEYYAYLDFCASKLPVNATYQLISSIGYRTSKAAYYLYPRREAEQPEYYLIYNAKPNIDLSDCSLFAKKNEAEYILKCN